MIWIVFAFLTGFAVVSVLWPLARSRRVATHAQSSREFYRAQIGEIKSDLRRGMLDEKEARIAETEAARRLIASDVQAKEFSASTNYRRAAAAVALILLPAIGLGLYLGLGSPDYRDRPLQSRLDAAPGKIELVAAVAKIERHLARNPNDGNGWQVIAPIYLRMNRAGDSIRAWRNLIRIKGESAPSLLGLGEALVAAGGGKVSAEASAAFKRTLTFDKSNWQARFFLGLAAEQTGDYERARKIWKIVLKSAPKTAPWREPLQARISALDALAKKRGEAKKADPLQKGTGPDTAAGKGIAALPPAQRRAAIRSMVDGLAARLEKNGGSLEEWTRLVRSYSVLGQSEKAAAALKSARKALAGNPDDIVILNRQAKSLGLGG